MTLDSFLPPELLLPSLEPDSPTSQETVQIGARFLEGHYEKGAFCISRVISTNPRDYREANIRPEVGLFVRSLTKKAARKVVNEILSYRHRCESYI